MAYFSIDTIIIYPVFERRVNKHFLYWKRSKNRNAMPRKHRTSAQKKRESLMVRDASYPLGISADDYMIQHLNEPKMNFRLQLTKSLAHRRFIRCAIAFLM